MLWGRRNLSQKRPFGDLDEIKRTELILFRSQFGHMTILLRENKGFLKAQGTIYPLAHIDAKGDTPETQSIRHSIKEDDIRNFQADCLLGIT